MQMENVTGKLDDINKTLKELTEAVRKPKENKLIRAFEIVAIIGGATTLLTAAEIIRNWILGG